MSFPCSLKFKDVMLGRGGESNFHSGNLRFRSFIADHKIRYQKARKQEKPTIAQEIVMSWRQLNPPGRFLARIDDSCADSHWYDVGDEVACKRAGRTLGERAAASRDGSSSRTRKRSSFQLGPVNTLNYNSNNKIPKTTTSEDFLARTSTEVDTALDVWKAHKKQHSGAGTAMDYVAARNPHSLPTTIGVIGYNKLNQEQFRSFANSSPSITTDAVDCSFIGESMRSKKQQYGKTRDHDPSLRVGETARFSSLESFLKIDATVKLDANSNSQRNTSEEQVPSPPVVTKIEDIPTAEFLTNHTSLFD